MERTPRIPDYELVRPLGRGRFGEVWLAKSHLGVHCAVKLVPKGRVQEIELAGLRTYAVLARKHDALVEIRHVGETGDWLYCVMELADPYETAPTFSADDYTPRTLEEDLRRKGPLGLERAAEIARTIASGLEHLHERGVLHRDVKPGNIVFVDGKPKLADVGLVTPAAQRATDAGTPSYMPPESVVDASGDLYCLGKTLFEMLTGAPAGTFPELPETLTSEQAAAWRRVAGVVDRACAPDRAERFKSAREFREALSVRTGRGAPRATRRKLVTVATVLPLVAALVLAALWLGPRLVAKDAAAAAAPPLEGSLRLLYQPPGMDTSRYVDERNPNVPLETDGNLWFRLELSEPAYPVVAYRDGEDVQILYPAKDDEQVALREHTSGSYPLLAPRSASDDTMTIVLLAAREPATPTDLAAIAEQLATLGPPPQCASNQLLFLGPDASPHTLQARDETTRGIDPERKTADAPPPIAELGLLTELHTAFHARFDVVRALSVPLVVPD